MWYQDGLGFKQAIENFHVILESGFRLKISGPMVIAVEVFWASPEDGSVRGLLAVVKGVVEALA